MCVREVVSLFVSLIKCPLVQGVTRPSPSGRWGKLQQKWVLKINVRDSPPCWRTLSWPRRRRRAPNTRQCQRTPAMPEKHIHFYCTAKVHKGEFIILSLIAFVWPVGVSWQSPVQSQTLAPPTGLEDRVGSWTLRQCSNRQQERNRAAVHTDTQQGAVLQPNAPDKMWTWLDYSGVLPDNFFSEDIILCIKQICTLYSLYRKNILFLVIYFEFMSYITSYFKGVAVTLSVQ